MLMLCAFQAVSCFLYLCRDPENSKNKLVFKQEENADHKPGVFKLFKITVSKPNTNTCMFGGSLPEFTAFTSSYFLNKTQPPEKKLVLYTLPGDFICKHFSVIIAGRGVLLCSVKLILNVNYCIRLSREDKNFLYFSQVVPNSFIIRKPIY